MQKTLIRFSVNLSTIRAIRKKCSEESSPNDGETNVILYLRVSECYFFQQLNTYLILIICIRSH